MKYLGKLANKYLLSVMGMMAATGLLAQETAATGATVESSPITSEPLFWVLLLVSLILMYVIYSLSEMVIWGVKRKMGDKGKGAAVITFLLLTFGLLGGNSAYAQEAATTVVQAPTTFWTDPYLPFYLLILVEVVVIAWLSYVLFNMLAPEKEVEPYVARQSMLSRVWQTINPTVPVEEEDDIKLEDHEYDGIVELGNKMPPWLQFMFYTTIIFALIYTPYYFLGYGKTMDEKYQNEVELAALEREERMKNSMNFMDENTVQVIQTADVLSAGKEIFNTYCAACHSESGGSMPGGVGPNLTDEYWLHGGSINDIFTTVKYGVPEKGMASWQEILMPKQISEVSNYILSLQGSNPPNAKEPQGELYTPEEESEEMPVDSTGTATSDSTVVALN